MFLSKRMRSETRWVAGGVMLAAGIVALYLMFDVPYLLFMKQDIEMSINWNIDLIHLSSAGLLIGTVQPCFLFYPMTYTLIIICSFVSKLRNIT